MARNANSLAVTLVQFSLDRADTAGAAPSPGAG